MFNHSNKPVLILLVAAAAVAAGTAWSTPALASEPFIAEIIMFGGNFAPRGWAFCNGQLLQIAQFQALFALLGTTYGGDGRTTFGLPDLRGRVPVHPGTAPGLSTYRLGQKGGLEQVTLTSNQMPSHTHTASAVVNATDNRGDAETPGGNVWAQKARDDDYSTAAPDVTMKADAVTVAAGNTGGGQAHENRQPYLAVNFIIALQGIFPPRN
jgi:microcystin-dependent protein